VNYNIIRFFVFLLIISIIVLTAPVFTPKTTIIERPPVNTDDDNALRNEINVFVNALDSVSGYSGTININHYSNQYYSSNFGYADRSQNRLINGNSRFPIGSVSKQFTAFIVFQLVNEGLIDYNTKVNEIITELQGFSAGESTIDELLDHKSGLPRYFKTSVLIKRFFTKRSRTRLINAALFKEIEINPNKKGQFNYSELGFVLLRGVIERSTSMSFKDNIRSRIFKPLEMNDSLVNTRNSGLLSKGYVVASRLFSHKKVYYELPLIDYSSYAGAAGIETTANDLMKWLEFLSNDPDRFLTVIKQRAPVNSPGYSHGLSTYINSENGLDFYSHHGYAPGYFSGVCIIKNAGFNILMLSNTTPVFIDKEKIYNPNTELIKLMSGKSYLIPASSSN